MPQIFLEISNRSTDSTLTDVHANMSATQSPEVKVVRQLLDNMGNPDVIRKIVGPSATYISLSFYNPDLKKIMPWCGEYNGEGHETIEVFGGVAHSWKSGGL